MCVCVCVSGWSCRAWRLCVLRPRWRATPWCSTSGTAATRSTTTGRCPRPGDPLGVIRGSKVMRYNTSTAFLCRPVRVIALSTYCMMYGRDLNKQDKTPKTSEDPSFHAHLLLSINRQSNRYAGKKILLDGLSRNFWNDNLRSTHQIEPCHARLTGGHRV